MVIEIDLDDRIYYDIKAYCEINKISLNGYLKAIVTEKHNINKFGDLNDLMTQTIEKSSVKVKDRVKSAKKDKENSEEKIKNNTQETEMFNIIEQEIENKHNLEENEAIINDINNKETIKTVVSRKKRNLKTL